MSSASSGLQVRSQNKETPLGSPLARRETLDEDEEDEEEEETSESERESEKGRWCFLGAWRNVFIPFCSLFLSCTGIVALSPLSVRCTTGEGRNATRWRCDRILIVYLSFLWNPGVSTRVLGIEGETEKVSVRRRALHAPLRKIDFINAETRGKTHSRRNLFARRFP